MTVYCVAGLSVFSRCCMNLCFTSVYFSRNIVICTMTG